MGRDLLMNRRGRSWSGRRTEAREPLSGGVSREVARALPFRAQAVAPVRPETIEAEEVLDQLGAAIVGPAVVSDLPTDRGSEESGAAEHGSDLTGSDLTGPPSPTLDLMSEDGMSTVEYAIGTVVAAAFAAVLYRIVTGDSIVAGLTNLVQSALNTNF